MSTTKNSVKVQIFGEEYTIRTGEDPEHTKAVAAHVDQAIRTVVATGAVVENHRAAILAAMQITDELFRMRSSDLQMADRINGLSSEMRRWLPPGKRPGGDA